MKVLIVDDVVSVRTRIAALLREIVPPVDILEAAEAETAFRFIESDCPEMVVLDLHLPGLNGLQMLPRIVRSKRRPLIVVLTNDASEQHRAQCLTLGADHFFDKSTDIDRFVQAVKDALPAAVDPSAP